MWLELSVFGEQGCFEMNGIKVNFICYVSQCGINMYMYLISQELYRPRHEIHRRLRITSQVIVIQAVLALYNFLMR